jgi:hypothetical protein
MDSTWVVVIAGVSVAAMALLGMLGRSTFYLRHSPEPREPRASLDVFDDIQYRIYVRRKIERGLEALRKGNVIPPEELEKRMARWLDK